MSRTQSKASFFAAVGLALTLGSFIGASNTALATPPTHAQLRQQSRDGGSAGLRARVTRVTKLLGTARQIRAGRTQRNDERLAQSRRLSSRVRSFISRLRGNEVTPIELQLEPESHHTQRYLQNGYHADFTQMLGELQTVAQNRSISSQERLRTIGAVARMVIQVEQEMPGTHSVAQLDEVQRMLGDIRVETRVGSHETSVEREFTSMTTVLIDAMTTHDGTIGPVLDEGGQPAGEWLSRYTRNGRLEVRQISWASLSGADKRRLLVEQSKGREFFRNRRMPGVRFSQSFRRARLANQRGGRANEQFSTEGITTDYIEYQGPSRVENVSGAEIHTRQHGSASETLRLAARFARALGYEPEGPTHQHITTTVSPELLQGDALERMGIVDFYRRVNLVGEMREVMDDRAIRVVRDEDDPNIKYFDFLRSSGLQDLNRHLASYSNGGRGAIGNHSHLKMAATGFRTGALYGSARLFGFEVRTLSRRSANDNSSYVNAVQRGLISRHYGISRTRYASFRQRFTRGLTGDAQINAEGDAIAAMHYNGDTTAMLASMPAGLSMDEATRTRFSNEANEHYGLKMLVHDWSRDIVLEGASPEFIQNVVRAQAAGLARYAEGGTGAAAQAVRIFVEESGLLERFEASIGMQ